MLTNHTGLEKIKDGISKAAKVITSTMGGHGKNVLMYKNGSLIFTKDGVSVARELAFKDAELSIGAQLLINAANTTVRECGDGTTLTSLLVDVLTKEMFAQLENVDFNTLVTTTEACIQRFIETIKNDASKIESTQDIYNIALTSCKNPVLAERIQSIFHSIGLDGSITLELTEGRTTYVEHTVGLSFDEGFVHQGFSNKDNGTCVFENPIFLIEEQSINMPQDYDPFIGDAHKEKRPVVFIASDYSDLFVRYALSNKERGVQICLIKIPGWADGRKQNIKDIKAFLTNGSANRIVVTPYSFTIFNNPPAGQIKKRVKILEAAIPTLDDWEQKEYRERITKIQQKSAIIYVGGKTSTAAKEEYDRIEDAVGAVKSAARLGFVSGAGSYLYNYSDPNAPSFFLNVLKAPHETIMSNARLTPTGQPINTKTKEVDLNLIDPVLVITSALENAFSLVKLLLTTDYALYE